MRMGHAGLPMGQPAAAISLLALLRLLLRVRQDLLQIAHSITANRRGRELTQLACMQRVRLYAMQRHMMP
jgi:hypothetical protein